jgi:ribosomal protein S4E
MARFKYNRAGHKRPDGRPYPATMPIIRINFSDGTHVDAPDQAKGFKDGDDIGMDIKNQRILRHLRADPRFTEIK